MQIWHATPSRKLNKLWHEWIDLHAELKKCEHNRRLKPLYTRILELVQISHLDPEGTSFRPIELISRKSAIPLSLSPPTADRAYIFECSKVT